MKFIAVLYAAALAGVSVNAAAIAQPNAAAEPWCWRPGQSCGKIKRSAVPEPEPDAEMIRRWCWRPGQSCGKLKRAADAAAEALAGPHADAEAHPIAKRAADALAEAIADAYAAAGPEPDAEAEPWCWRPGQSCGKVKRAATAISEALDLDEPESEEEALARRWCWRPGQSCGKAKRAADALAEAAAKAVAVL